MLGKKYYGGNSSEKFASKIMKANPNESRLSELHIRIFVKVMRNLKNGDALANKWHKVLTRNPS